MMAGERLAVRVARLERKVDEGFQATSREIEALRSEMNGRFEQVDRRFGHVDDHFAVLRKELRTHMDVIAKRLESRIQVLAEGMQAFLDRLGGREQRVQAVEHRTESLDLRVTALEGRRKRRG